MSTLRGAARAARPLDAEMIRAIGEAMASRGLSYRAAALELGVPATTAAGWLECGSRNRSAWGSAPDSPEFWKSYSAAPPHTQMCVELTYAVEQAAGSMLAQADESEMKLARAGSLPAIDRVRRSAERSIEAANGGEEEALNETILPTALPSVVFVKMLEGMREHYAEQAEETNEEGETP